MSKETLEWLNANTLIGFTDKRSTAWHYRASDQGAEPNHYVGPIPVEDVHRRLFHWTALEAPTFFEYNGDLIPSEKKTIVRSDTGQELGSFKEGYKPHQYGNWLLKNIATILDDNELSVSSAGLLRKGGVAWVEVGIPENITTPEGVEFRPNFLAATSFDGSLATTYTRTVQQTVCDNTMTVALSEAGQKVKVRHSKNSLTKIGDIREALAIIHTVSDEFAAQVAELCSVKVTENQFEQIVDHLKPLPETDGSTSRALTMAENYRDELFRLWSKDERCTPWRNTAFGAMQVLNTYDHHSKHVRGMERAERNMLAALRGTTEKNDTQNRQMILSLVA
jgi:phage/plasmid-like protein (TIGR03299 family)